MQNNAVGFSDIEKVGDYYSSCIECIANTDHLAFKKQVEEMSAETFAKVLQVRDDGKDFMLPYVQVEQETAKQVYDLLLQENIDKAEITKAFNRYNSLLFIEHIIKINARKMAQAVGQA